MKRRSTRTCQWPGCASTIPIWQWGCREHFSQLPDEIAHDLKTIKHWWPEWKVAAKKAVTAARAIKRADQQPRRTCSNSNCGAPLERRYGNGLCVPCHIAWMTGDKT